MATLTYWVCRVKRDDGAYNIRAKTRKEAAALRESYGADRYEATKKVVVPYDDAFGLMLACMGENRRAV
jgi:hypothetical protein